MKSVDELDKHIGKYIQGGFGQGEMAVMKEEAEKLEAGDIYVEIGVDEGRSARVFHEYADPDVFGLFIDIHDHGPVPDVTISRAVFMEQEGMVGLNKKRFYVHGDADEFANIFYEPINLMFIDGHHDYDSVKNNTLLWETKMIQGGVILFHDYDHPETKRWLDEHYGEDMEIIGGKIVRVRV